MKNILKNHIKSNVRFQEGDLILYEPNQEQIEEIKKLIQDNSNINEDLDLTGEINFNSIRFIIRELTSIGNEIDDMTDNEVISSINNGDKSLQRLIDKISELINEIAENLYNEQIKQIKLLNTYLNVMNNEKDVDKMKEKINKLFKKNKIDLTFDDLQKLKGNNKNDIKELIDKLKL